MKLKNKSVLFILMGCALLLFNGPALNAQKTDYKPLLGTWDIEADAGGQVIAFSFVFSMEEGELKGILSFEMGEGEMTDIQFDGKTLTFKVSLDFGEQSMDIDCNAEIDGKSLTGTISSMMGEASISGTKSE